MDDKIFSVLLLNCCVAAGGGGGAVVVVVVICLIKSKRRVVPYMCVSLALRNHHYFRCWRATRECETGTHACVCVCVFIMSYFLKSNYFIVYYFIWVACCSRAVVMLLFEEDSPKFIMLALKWSSFISEQTCFHDNGYLPDTLHSKTKKDGLF